MTAHPDGNQVFLGVTRIPDLTPESPIHQPRTCKIVSADTAAGYVIVNVTDFDAETMLLFVA